MLKWSLKFKIKLIKLLIINCLDQSIQNLDKLVTNLNQKCLKFRKSMQLKYQWLDKIIKWSKIEFIISIISTIIIVNLLK